MTLVRLVSPFRCRVWDLHERLETEITEETCKAEIQSFLKEGQLIPALGRDLKGDPTHDIELIYGARRLFVARHLNVPLAVELREISDRQAIIAMDIENRQRKDVSAYERGTSYARWLQEGYFESQADIARALHLSRSQISRLLRLARLPAEIVAAFASPMDLCERWSIELVNILEDAFTRQLVTSAAQEISALSPRPSAIEVYQRLLASAMRGRRREDGAGAKVVTDLTGATLFRVRRHSKFFTLLLPGDKVSVSSLQRIQEAVLKIVQEQGTRYTVIGSYREGHRPSSCALL